MTIYDLQDFMIGFVAGVAFLGFAIAFAVALVVNFGKDSDPRRLSRERPGLALGGPWAATPASTVDLPPDSSERSSTSSQPGSRAS